MYFYGDESEIDLEKYGEREFSEWRWMPLDDLPNEVQCAPSFFKMLSRVLQKCQGIKIEMAIRAMQLCLNCRL